MASPILDASLAFAYNCGSVVPLIFVNKELLSGRGGFAWANTLAGLHFGATSLFSAAEALRARSVSSAGPRLPRLPLVLYTAISVASISMATLSLELNSVGVYQTSKIAIVALTCILDALSGRKFTLYTVASVVVVLLGVSLTVGDALSASAAGVAVGAASVVTTCLQQQGTARLQLDYGMTSKAFVAQTFYWQALVLLGLGPLVDTALLGVSPLAWPGFRPAGRPQILWLAASCVLAVAANFSQVMCFRTLSPTSFQVLGTAKTVLVLVGGWLLFAHADLAARTLWGQAIAVAGMALYGHSKLLDGAAAVVAAPALPDKAAAGETVEGGALAGPATIVVAP